MAFSGFPPRVRYTPVPNPFFGPLLEEIDDLAELKCTLRVLWLLHQKKGYPRVVTLRELLADQTLSKALMTPAANREAAIRGAVAKATKRGTLLCTLSTRGGVQEQVYLLNTEADRRALARVQCGDVSAETPPGVEPWQGPETKPNIFSLYEENIGTLSPLIADELKEAEQLYPQEWIEEAFREAVSLNKRSWRYIARILERWEREGKGDGDSGRHSETIDPEAYIRVYRNRPQY